MKWLRLVRLPTVFTAMADVFLGFLVSHGGSLQPSGSFLILLLASSSLYFAGMVFNDVFDLQRDRIEQPNRPIPSGAVSRRAATLFGVGLFACGIVSAAFVGKASLVVAVMIVASVLCYDWLLKQTPFAPIAMGSCRFLNVLLGGSDLSNVGDVANAPLVCAAFCLGIYVAGLTLFARREATGGNTSQLVAGAMLITLSLGLLAAIGLRFGTDLSAIVATLGLLTVAALLGVRLARAVKSGLPADIGRGIRYILLCLIVVNASMVLALSASWLGALATTSLLVPAMTVKKWIPLT